jgi:hypothetical protein
MISYVRPLPGHKRGVCQRNTQRLWHLDIFSQNLKGSIYLNMMHKARTCRPARDLINGIYTKIGCVFTNRGLGGAVRTNQHSGWKASVPLRLAGSNPADANKTNLKKKIRLARGGQVKPEHGLEGAPLPATTVETPRGFIALDDQVLQCELFAIFLPPYYLLPFSCVESH